MDTSHQLKIALHEYEVGSPERLRPTKFYTADPRPTNQLINSLFVAVRHQHTPSHKYSPAFFIQSICISATSQRLTSQLAACTKSVPNTANPTAVGPVPAFSCTLAVSSNAIRPAPMNIKAPAARFPLTAFAANFQQSKQKNEEIFRVSDGDVQATATVVWTL